MKFPTWDRENTASKNDLYSNSNLISLEREDGTVSNGNDKTQDITDKSPVKISRNGYVIYQNSSGNSLEFGNDNSDNSNNFRSFEQDNKLIKAEKDNRVNAVIISSLIPSRATQAYGGLHNFPRFNERWSVDLFISGSLLQLNFSTTGTAPFDQDSWEPSHRPTGSKENTRYYSPPKRRWGYDVGLQLAPAGPVEERFVTNSSDISEFFQQLPIDDRYIFNLRCGKDDKGDIVVDPSVDANQCPSQ